MTAVAVAVFETPENFSSMHWHGYAWTGPRIGLSALRDGARELPSTDVQPLSIDVQLKRIAETATVFTTHVAADEALAWLETALQDYPRAARDPLPRRRLPTRGHGWTAVGKSTGSTTPSTAGMWSARCVSAPVQAL
ncbi:hypothetical protein [Streptomyces sp. NPDC059743]|uniref:hypothetical protein n=1 Tax=Streptomyces sp. NPDC059743 TaxID=3346928 RepID=UPI0036529C19